MSTLARQPIVTLRRHPGVVAPIGLALLAACGAAGGDAGTNTTEPPPTPAAVASVTVAPDSARTGANLLVGDQLPLTVTLRDANGNVLTGRAITYRSADESVATVSAQGVIAAVAEGGPVAVTVTSEQRSATASLRVVRPFALVSVRGQAPPVTVQSGLVALGGRFVAYPGGRYVARIDYQSGAQLDVGSFVVAGNQYTFTRDVGGTFQGTLNGSVLSFTFTDNDVWVFQR